MKQKLKGGEEYDMLSPWRHYLNHDRGRSSFAKRKARRRLRKELRVEIKEIVDEVLYA